MLSINLGEPVYEPPRLFGSSNNQYNVRSLALLPTSFIDDLATEIVLTIFESLDYLDDAYHLARCCKRLNRIYEKKRQQILGSIIIYSKAHKFDQFLSEAVKINRDWCSQHCHYGASNINLQLHGNCRRRVRKRLKELLSTELESRSEPKNEERKIPEHVLWDIVTRWGAMQAIGNIYSDPKVITKFRDFQVPSTSFPSDNFNFATPGDVGLSRCGPRAQAETRSMDVPKFARMYFALSAIWLVQELEMAALSAYWATSKDLEDMRSNFSVAVHSLTVSTSDILDMTEVSDFIFGFCMEKVFAGCGNAYTWLRNTPWHRQAQRTTNGVLPKFARGPLQRVLRPSDILELVLLCFHSPSLPGIDKSQFLCDRGLLDYTQGIDGYCIGDGSYQVPNRTQGFVADYCEVNLPEWLTAMYTPNAVRVSEQFAVSIGHDTRTVFKRTNSPSNTKGPSDKLVNLANFVNDSCGKYRLLPWREELRGRLFAVPPMTNKQIGEGILRRYANEQTKRVMDQAEIEQTDVCNASDDGID